MKKFKWKTPVVEPTEIKPQGLIGRLEKRTPETQERKSDIKKELEDHRKVFLTRSRVKR